MIRTLPLFVILLAACPILRAQDGEKQYFDDRLAVTSKRAAKYYKVADGVMDGNYIGRMFTIDGKLRSEGTYADPELRVEHGLFTFYHANGNVESKGEYVMGHKSGVWERYDATGRPLAEKIYDPEPLANIIYTRAQTMPQHQHGSDREFVRYIKANVSSPKGKRVKGSVLTSFVVEKNGSLTDVKVVNGKDEAVDRQVVQAIRSSAPWQPGIDKGQPVRVLVRMPVQF